MTSWKFRLLLCSAACICAFFPRMPAAESVASAPAAKPGHSLVHLVIGDSVEAVQHIVPDASAPFLLVSPALASFDKIELTKRLSSGEGRVIDERLLAAVAQVVENFLRQFGYPTATVVVPTQSIAEGVVRLIVNLGVTAQSLPATEWKIRNINVKGAHWFSEALLREKLQIEQGETIRYSDLDRAVNWTNNNPFRRVAVQLNPVPNTGEADLNIAVQDALPLRLSVSADNGGNSVIGRNRYVAALSYANLWGLDHQISYQYITTNLPKYYQAHGLDYRMPLPWRHYLQFSGSYFHAQPIFADGFFGQDGETITADLRYSVPITRGQATTDLYASIGFKESNNNLTWDPTFWNVLAYSTKTDIFQLTLGASTVRRDQLGAWAFGANLILSPGGINSRNSDAAFDAGAHGGGDSARVGAEARYMYGTVSIQRMLTLGNGWDLISRAMLQASAANLLSSEQLTIGGSSSVRGYNENIMAGDNGYVFSTELMAPMMKRALPYISKRRGPLEGRFLGFFDMGDTAAHRKFPGEPKRVPLASAGIGVRMGLATNFSLAVDYGWQILTLPYPVDGRSRAHIKATLSF